MQNIGHLYYKEYFNDLQFNQNGKILNTSFKTDKLFNLNLTEYTEKAILLNEDLDKASFLLITTYPGLLIGSGYNHEVGEKELENELKLGFYFDHTTGLPCIPGSSVKGVLRDASEKDNGNYILSIIKDLASDNDEERKTTKEIKKLAKKFWENGKNKNLLLKGENKKHSEFVKQVFEGKKNENDYIPFKERDIFFDTFPVESFNKNGKFLANDYITHHPDPLKNPNPVQFLKVLPQVMFRFDFKLTDIIMPKALKLELFRQILLDLGIGAKTNVGYGQFIGLPMEDSGIIPESFVTNRIEYSCEVISNYGDIYYFVCTNENIKFLISQVYTKEDEKPNIGDTAKISFDQ